MPSSNSPTKADLQDLLESVLRRFYKEFICRKVLERISLAAWPTHWMFCVAPKKKIKKMKKMKTSATRGIDEKYA